MSGVFWKYREAKGSRKVFCTLKVVAFSNSVFDGDIFFE
jgi:hypothetical protein